MYARKENQEIVRYRQLPKELLVNGEWIPITEENAQTYGFLPLLVPMFDSRVAQRSGKIIKAGSHYEYEVIARDRTLVDLKKELLTTLKGYWREAINEREYLLDYAAVSGQQMPQAVQNKIATLFSLLAQTRQNIADLDSVESALNYEFPGDRIETGLNYLRELV